jgi:alpha-1,2-mannosyltransferase
MAGRPAKMSGFIDSLRNGAWLTRDRMRLVALAMLAVSLLGAALLIATSDGLLDLFGRPLGTDFGGIYAAGHEVLEGHPLSPFDLAAHYAKQKAIFGAAAPFYSWHYPPFYLGIVALLALMPFPLSLAVWQGVTFALYLLAIRAILATQLPRLADSDTGGKLWLLFAIAFPAVFINLGHGHNGFLTASLFSGALLLLDRRPIIAGILFGCLIYKPQFGLMIPVVLVAGERWRAFAAAAATVIMLALAATLAFGPEVWTTFLASTKFTREVVLETNEIGWNKIQSTFSWVRMWGGGVTLAYAAQGAMAVFAAASLAWLWRSRAQYAIKAAGLPLATLLATPYSIDYDLMLLAPAIAYLAADGVTRGFAPWQKTILAALWIMPLLTRSVAEATHIPLTVPTILLAFGVLLRRAIDDTGAASASGVLPREA